ncbi:hypothetical protein JSQ73_004100 [Wolbachia endosymbiont of Anopheles demeilloni]|uniref:WBM0748 family T4SS-associated protein n=1 Tax=Wolbachia endosymbiont of Anopheles demeilloni TaxID=2748871 RepID=UPI001BDA1609|nr:hypothetical protein [Wolbachia endosymbiont of Anopheles demeilloni]UIP92361.1 hypothetical protein JSQ73_004100 [Wolbachia endosymbiont of Anopheles demeilloni]
MSLKNEISELIEQQLGIKYHDNCLAYIIHNSVAGEISDSISLCIVGCGDCEIKYQGIANSFNITKEEINQSNIESIKNKIESEARKEGSGFSELISRMDQSLKEQSEKSITQILNSSAEEMLRSFCGSSIQRTEDKEVSLSSASHEEPATEDSETTINSDLLSI